MASDFLQRNSILRTYPSTVRRSVVTLSDKPKSFETKFLGLVSHTGIRLSQDKALVQLGHLRSFYKCV